MWCSICPALVSNVSSCDNIVFYGYRHDTDRRGPHNISNWNWSLRAECLCNVGRRPAIGWLQMTVNNRNNRNAAAGSSPGILCAPHRYYRLWMASLDVEYFTDVRKNKQKNCMLVASWAKCKHDDLRNNSTLTFWNATSCSYSTMFNSLHFN